MNNIFSKISLRPVSASDRKMVFTWRNTPYLIKLGSSGRAVTWEEHCRWFDKIIGSTSNTTLLIVNLNAIPVGQIRFELTERHRYLVSIYFLEEYTGRGIGSIALQKGLKWMSNQDAICTFVAFIKMDNKASRAVFLKTGFAELKNCANIPLGHIAMVYSPGQT